MIRKICSAATRPSPVVPKSRKIKWPLCSPPKLKPLLQHLLNHVFVADGGANDFAAGGFDGGFQTGVAHHGGDQGFFGERFLRQHVQRGDGHDVVAVDQRAVFVAEQDAVGVAVVRDAQVRLVFDDLAAEMFRVHRAAVFVDVAAVGLVAINDDFRAQFPQDAGRGFVGRAVRAIHDDAQAFERQTAREGLLANSM